MLPLHSTINLSTVISRIRMLMCLLITKILWTLQACLQTSQLC